MFGCDSLAVIETPGGHSSRESGTGRERGTASERERERERGEREREREEREWYCHRECE